MIGKEYAQMENNNIHHLSNNKDYVDLLKEIGRVREFFSSYSFLQFGRDMEFLLVSKQIIFRNGILVSSEQTLGSIHSCCQLGNFADVNILLRKYRDDLFFYLYITVTARKQATQDKKATQNIKSWIENNLDDLYIGEVLKTIGKSSNLSDAIEKYNLQKSFDQINTTLNGYVHAKGIKFYNKLFSHYQDDELSTICKDIVSNLNHITTVFIFLSALCNPISIMSTDYMDYRDMGDEPPSESQYWVAPFIVEYLNANKSFLDENCIMFLQEQTNMQLDESLPNNT